MHEDAQVEQHNKKSLFGNFILGNNQGASVFKSAALEFNAEK